MKTKKQPFNLRDWQISKDFSPHLFDSWGWRNCGSALIAMITGESPATIEKKFLGNRATFSTRRLRATLFKFGWETKEIGPYGISNLQTDGWWKQEPFFFNQCLFILGAWTTKTDQSWFLHCRRTVYHNGEPWSINGFNFAICNPISDIIIARKVNQ